MQHRESRPLERTLRIRMTPETPTAADEGKEYDGTVVVVDALRASATVIAALRSGATEVVPVADLEEARRRAATHPSGSCLIGGERGGLPPEGFALGNSPAEYTPERVAGRTIVLTTTNGARAWRLALGAPMIIWGTFRNASGVARHLADRTTGPVELVCAGSDGRFALEDLLAAGAIADRLMANSPAREEAPHGGCTWHLDDAARAALLLFRSVEDDLVGHVMQTDHARRLAELGLASDILHCAELDVDARIVPIRVGKGVRLPEHTSSHGPLPLDRSTP